MHDTIDRCYETLELLRDRLDTDSLTGEVQTVNEAHAIVQEFESELEAVLDYENSPMDWWVCPECNSIEIEGGRFPKPSTDGHVINTLWCESCNATFDEEEALDPEEADGLDAAFEEMVDDLDGEWETDSPVTDIVHLATPESEADAAVTDLQVRADESAPFIVTADPSPTSEGELEHTHRSRWGTIAGAVDAARSLANGHNPVRMARNV